MFQVFLNDAQIDTSSKQMGGPGMSQGRNGGWCGDAAFVKVGLEGALDPIWSPGVLARLKNRREKPNRIAMGNPIPAQQIQDGFGQGNIAVFPTFSMADMPLPVQERSLRSSGCEHSPRWFSTHRQYRSY